MKSAKFSTLRKYLLASSHRNIRKSLRLVGGVLLVALFALIPNSVSAYQNISIPSNNSDLRFNTNHRIYGGCMFKSYNINSEFTAYLGDLIDGSHNCGYAKSSNGGLSHWSNEQVGYVQSTYNGSSWTYGNPTTLGGSNILSSWGTENANSLGGHAYNTLHDIMLNLQDCPSGSNQCSNGIKLNSNINGYAIFVYSYKPTTDVLGSNGINAVRTQAVGNGWNFYTSGGSLISSDDFNVNDYADEVSSTMIFGSYSSEQLQNLLPSNMQDFNRGDEYMYIIGAFPTYADKYLQTTQLQILAPKGISYNWTDYTAGLGDAMSEGVLNLDGYFDFLTFQSGGSYKQIGTTINQFAISDVQFGLSLCTTSDECDYYSNFNELYKTTHSENLQPITPSGNQSIFMSWFNVFSFGFTFPFRFLFSSFTDSNQCADIPIIAGMLHSTSTQYCTWWSPQIRNILTPVFSFFSIMLLTGFIFSFLKGHSDPIAVGSDDSVEHGQYHHPKGFPL